jgi:hypothetical protein
VDGYVKQSMSGSVQPYPDPVNRHKVVEVDAPVILSTHVAWHLVKRFRGAVRIPTQDALGEIQQAYTYLDRNLEPQMIQKIYQPPRDPSNVRKWDAELIGAKGHGKEAGEWGARVPKDKAGQEIIQSDTEYLWLYEVRPRVSDAYEGTMVLYRAVAEHDLFGYTGEDGGYKAFAFSSVHVSTDGSSRHFLGFHALRMEPHYPCLSVSQLCKNIICTYTSSWPTAQYEKCPVLPSLAHSLTEVSAPHVVIRRAIDLRQQAGARFWRAASRFRPIKTA